MTQIKQPYTVVAVNTETYQRCGFHVMASDVNDAERTAREEHTSAPLLIAAVFDGHISSIDTNTDARSDSGEEVYNG